MGLKSLRRGVRLLIGVWVLCLGAGAGAQENLDRGKSPAQLFGSDCLPCHKAPQGLVKSGGFGLENFLREHYTASRESASAIAGYLRSVDSGPSGRALKRTAKGDEKPKVKKGGARSGEAKGSEKPNATAPDAKSAEPKSSESSPAAQIMSPEPKPSVPPAGGESKPAEAGAKSE